jgi:hypothetical protein
MAVTGIAINAAMFAALVRVYRIHMAQIGAVRFAYYLFGFSSKIACAYFPAIVHQAFNVSSTYLFFKNLLWVFTCAPLPLKNSGFSSCDIKQIC